MIVLKFGGTSVGDADRLAAVAAIVARRSGPRVVVASAMAGVTDDLVRAGELAAAGQTAEARWVLGALVQRHRRALRQLRLPAGTAAALRQEIERAGGRLRDLVLGVALLRELSARTSDALLATGEILSSRLLAAALAARGVAAAWLDPRELMVTDATFGAAVPDEAAIAERVRSLAGPHLAAGEVVVTGGFVGATPEGETTTLGRGGSDYSAALLAAALPARELEIWTDVDGILTVDPRLVSGGRVVPVLSYAEAAELAFFGAKVLHPATLRPAARAGIPVLIKNTFQPESPGTAILAEAPGTGVRAIAARRGSTALLLSNPRMLLAAGYAARVFAVFERLRVPVDVITTSEVSIAVTVDSRVPFDALVRELRELAEVEVLAGQAVVSVVGQRLRSTPGVAARAFQCLGRINVTLISQGASDTNLTFVVAEGDVEEAMERLHRAFFEESAEAAWA